MSAKIRLVTQHNADTGAPERYYLVRAHTCAVAEKHVARKHRRFIEAKTPTQDELVEALAAGIPIESAYPDDLPTPAKAAPEGEQP